MDRIYDSDNSKPINPITGVIETKVIDSHKRSEDKRKKEEEKTDSDDFSKILDTEIEKIRKVLRR